MKTFRYQFRQKKKDVRKGSTQVTQDHSAKEKKELDLFQHPAHRRYFCHNCKETVTICLLCDHGHKYCPPCKKESKRNSNKKSNAQYRRTLRGKRIRAACESRRREIIKKNLNNIDSCKIMGETSTNITKVLPNTKTGTEVVPEGKNIDLEKGENNVPVSKTQVDGGNTLGIPAKRGDNKTILCAYCSRECSSLAYDKVLPKKIYKKRYWQIRNSYHNKGFKL